MNRIQFMLELAALLQDISVEERTEAMKYYNDYFDEAGEENEAEIIRELGSPAKVAAEIKAGLGGKAGEEGEFRETGYTDPRFERRESPARPGGPGPDSQRGGTGYGTENGGPSAGYSSNAGGYGQPRGSRTWKIILIVLILLVCSPVVVPVGLVLLCVVAGLAIAAFAVFFAFALAAVVVAVVGVVLFFAGMMALVPDLPTGLALIGSGMILAVIGAILTVAAVRLCIIVLPGLFRFFVELCRRPFHRRKAVG